MKRYIGNKEKLLEHISDFIDKNNVDATTFTDLYSGTGSVACYFRTKYKVIANDIMHYSYVVLKGKLSFNGVPDFKKFPKSLEYEPIVLLNRIVANKNKNSIVWKHFSPEGNRKYFTEDNALKIDGARQLIDEWKKLGYINKNEWFYLLACILTAANSKGNTTGTFGAFLKQFSVSAYKDIEFKLMADSTGPMGKVYSVDGKELVQKIETDILYLDPPYTAIDYSQAYHFLESLSLYDQHEYFGITGRRINNEKVSRYTKKSSAIEEFEETIKLAKKSKNVVLSYSSHGIMTKSQIDRVLKKYYKEVKFKQIKHPKYRNYYKNDKGELYEYLFLAKERKNETHS